MKIEILEVFVTRTDAMTMDQIPSAIGIAALEPRENAVPANVIRPREIKLYKTLLNFFKPKKRNPLFLNGVRQID
jgi:hypothetical protein